MTLRRPEGDLDASVWFSGLIGVVEGWTSGREVLGGTECRVLGAEFGADDGDVVWCFDAESHLSVLDAHDRDDHVVTDDELLHQLTCENQHVHSPTWVYSSCQPQRAVGTD